MADKPTNTRRVPDFLLSWDRLGFRLLVFGSLALAWILQGLLAGLPWQKLMLTEAGGLMPWAFLAPMVLALDRRIQSSTARRGGLSGRAPGRHGPGLRPLLAHRCAPSV